MARLARRLSLWTLSLRDVAEFQGTGAMGQLTLERAKGPPVIGTRAVFQALPMAVLHQWRQSISSIPNTIFRIFRRKFKQ
jgi:hypothetical protein